MKWRIAGIAALLVVAGYLGYKWVEDPRNQLFGKTLVSGPPDERLVALTFDDGPNPPFTDRILDVLRDEHVRATFFVVGRAVAAHPAEVARMAREGDALGNHTWDHQHLLALPSRSVDAELARTDDAIFHATGTRPRLMRPPFGARDFDSLSQVRHDGYTVVMWSVPLPKDWEQPGDATIAARVIDKVSPGSIIVLHDGNRGMLCGVDRRVPPRACDRGQDVAATRTIIETLRSRGYTFVTIPELMHAAHREAALTHTPVPVAQ
jgi:peptidoglycan/xylan/chitin deacetylase (PgdA/CDA1 family)